MNRKWKSWKDVRVWKWLRENRKEVAICALVYALVMHKGLRRKDSKKRGNFIHTYRVVQILIFFGVDDDEILATAALHDVPEDVASVHIKNIADQFDSTITKLVINLSINCWPGSSKLLHYIAVFSDYRSIIVKLADRLHNLKNLSKNIGSETFFTTKRLKDQTDDTIINIVKRYGRMNRFHPYSSSAKRIILEILKEIAIAERKLQNIKNSTK